MQKLTSVLLSLLVLLSAVISPVSGAELKFKDVPPNYYASKEISYLVSSGIIRGYVDRTFKPAKTVTRAEFATFITRALELEMAESSFKDLDKNNDLYYGVSSAAKAGIVKGFADGTFKGGLPVTREDMAVMIDRAIQLKGKYPKTKPLDFSDSAQIGGYAKKSIERLYYYGIMGPYSGKKFDGKVVGSRAETARFLYRMIKLFDSDEYVAPAETIPHYSPKEIEAIKKKNSLTLTHDELVGAYGPYVILVRRDMVNRVKGIKEWDLWEDYLMWMQYAKEYKWKKVPTPNEFLNQELPNVYNGVPRSYPDYEVIAFNGVPFIYSELYNLGNNAKNYQEIEYIATPPKEKGLFKIDIHFNKQDFVTYFREVVKAGKLNVIPYSKDNKALMLDINNAFKNTPEVKITSNSISYKDKTLTFTNGSNQAKVNGKSVSLSVAPELNEGAQMLPIRESAKLIGLETRVMIWGAAKRIEILNYTEEYSDPSYYR